LRQWLAADGKMSGNMLRSDECKTVQELQWHAYSLGTMNLYAQAVTEAKRHAQSRLVGMLFDDNLDRRSTALIGTKWTYEKIIQSRKLLN
jgi:hypothetical protein